jgi:hypothetical protein
MTFHLASEIGEVLEHALAPAGAAAAAPGVEPAVA